MLLNIENVLSEEECRAISDAVGAPEFWRDGKDTAKGAAKAVKNNQQADPNAPAVKGALATIQSKLAGHPVFEAAAQVDAFIRLSLNRYGAGMSYGEHVDAPYINGARTDLSFTLFLSAPNEYEGGSLVIDNAGHEDSIRGAAGSLVLYPSRSLHRVELVKGGTRLACIGWVKSRVRSAENRALLFEMETALADLRECGTPAPVYNRLLNIRNNLLRTFGD
jgi:PKHD-type hydroxylase